jgi:hypothetical protein
MKGGLMPDVILDGVMPRKKPAAKGPHVANDGNVVGDEIHGGFRKQRDLAVRHQRGEGAREQAGNADLVFQHHPAPFMRQRLGFLINQQNMVVHTVADQQIGPHDFGQGVALICDALHGFGHAALHFGMDGIADQVQDIFFGGDILIERADRDPGCFGNLAGRGFVKTVLNEKFDRRVDDLVPPSLDQILIFNLGRNLAFVFLGGDAHACASLLWCRYFLGLEREWATN